MARILIVDPNPRMRSLIAGHLTGQGHKVLLADHGVAAALLLRQHPADLVLVDQQVPMGGIKTARLLRLHPACQRVPILLLVDSRQALPDLLAEGRRAQIRQIVSKPCTAAVLQAKIEEGLRQRLERLSVTAMREEIGQLSGLPVLLSSHRRMLSLLSHEDGQVEVPELIRTIELDQGLTTEVLRVCHSVYYGFRGNTLEAAVTFLGIDKIRRIVQAAIIFDLFGANGDVAPDGFNLLALWKHSVACGLVMEAGGRKVRGRDHFIAGMLHDVGKVVLYLRFREYFDEVARLAREENRSFIQAEQDLIGVTHTDIGHELARRWDLPPTIAGAIAFHHRPSAALQHQRLASLVHLSDILSRTMQIGHAGDRQPIRVDPAAEPLARYVFAVEEQRQAIEAEVESVVSRGQSGA